MHVRRFEAASLAEALGQVREAFGPDALVLSTREVRRDGGWLGLFGRPVVEVTAAIDRDVRREAAAAAAAAARGGPPVPGPEGRDGRAPGRVGPDPSWSDLRLSRALIEPLESEVSALRRRVEELGGVGALPLAAEVAELRRVARELTRRRGGGKKSAWTRRYLAAGFAPDHAESLGSDAAARAKAGAGESEALVASLAARLDARLAPVREDDPPLALYVGPTGAGKTTSLAKVAARECAGPGALGLVTTDAHRLGADAALRAHAHNLELPFDVAVSEEALSRVVKRGAARRWLIDTAGRSPSDAGLAELRALRAALGEAGQVQLVLSATTKESDLQRALAWYRPLAPDALVVTKLDESGDLGNVANLILDGDAPPLAWIGDGQRVPQDLVLPEPRELACRLLGVSPAEGAAETGGRP